MQDQDPERTKQQDNVIVQDVAPETLAGEGAPRLAGIHKI